MSEIKQSRLLNKLPNNKLLEIANKPHFNLLPAKILFTFDDARQLLLPFVVWGALFIPERGFFVKVTVIESNWLYP
ncbi:hypothetical protein [Chitinophaga hostae]|uniref:hypothetical protein n=1 Tax=Chitinophaga TaxID=79328 RepID=UPI003F6A0AAF